MTKGGERTDHKPIGPGDEAWIWWENVRAASPSERAIREEIERFERMKTGTWWNWSAGQNRNVQVDNPTCPYYHKLYDEELDKYLASAGLSW